MFCLLLFWHPPFPYILLSRPFAWTRYLQQVVCRMDSYGFSHLLSRPLADKVFATNVALKQQPSHVHILETVYWGALAHCYVGCWGSCNIRCAPKKVGEMYSQNKLCFTKGKWGWKRNILLGEVSCNMRSVQEQGNSSILERYWGGWKENISFFSGGGVPATRDLWDFLESSGDNLLKMPLETLRFIK